MTAERKSSLVGEETAQLRYASHVRPDREVWVGNHCRVGETESCLPQSRVKDRPPALDPLHGIRQTVDPVGIAAVNRKDSIDRFNQYIVSRLRGTRGVDLDPVLIRRQVQSLAGELAAVTAEQLLRNSTFLLQPV